jgi:anti-sigma-K factor RskA
MTEHGDHLHRIHRRVWDLLPWYVNGTLAPDEHRRVEDHVAGCPLCREEVERSRRLAAMVRATDEVAPAPHPAELRRLLARLGEDGEDGEEEERDPAPVRRRWPGPAWLRRLAVAQAAALAALLALVALLLAERAAIPTVPTVPPATYRTLSAPEPAAAGGALRIRLLFAPETPERELRTLLAGIEGQLAGGPSPLGVYTVAVPAGPAADPLPVVLAYLRSHPAVRFAEPAADFPAGAAR